MRVKWYHRAQTPMLAPGTQVHGKYRIVRWLAAGGFGDVYVAEHVRIPGPPVALKVLHPQYAQDARFRERFFREIAIARTLVSPHIVTLRDSDVTPEGECYFTMDLVPGEPLSEIAAREMPLSWRRALAIVRQLLIALAVAHRRGVVHRDVKPENLLVEKTRAGKDYVRVLDFGTATLRTVLDSPRTANTGFIGTPRFMAPEQALDQEVDGRADLYSAAAVLHLLVTGQVLFDGDSPVAILFKHQSAPPPPIRLVRPDLGLPEPLEALVLRALAKEPGARFATAEAMIAEIDLLASGPAAPGPQGRVIDRYEIEEKIAAEGTGDVHRARHLYNGRTVALKILSADTASDASFVERFRREAFLAACFRHPGAVQVYDFGEDRGVFFLAMELVEGETLRALLRREGTVPLERALHIADRVLAALAAAHAAGLVHANLKPENVVIGRDGRVRVAEFGVARIFAPPKDAPGERSGAFSFVGTPEYMAPEVWRGEAAGPPSDLYALGAILLEMLSGRPPFTCAKMRQYLAAHLTQAPPTLFDLCPDLGLPPSLDAAIGRALAKSAAERFPDAQAMRRMLEGVRFLVTPEAIAGPESGRYRRPGAAGLAVPAADRARLLIGTRTDFLFTTPTLAFGRAPPGAPDGTPDNAIVLWALPCRTPELDPENFRRTLEIAAHHGEFVLWAGQVCLIDRSTSGIALDGVRVPRDVPVPLPRRFRCEILGAALALSGLIVPADPRAPPAALRLERLGDAPRHAYVWIVGQVAIGPPDGAIPVPDEPGLAASIANVRGSLALVRPPEPARALLLGESIEGKAATVVVRELEPADMTRA